MSFIFVRLYINMFLKRHFSTDCVQHSYLTYSCVCRLSTLETIFSHCPSDFHFVTFFIFICPHSIETDLFCSLSSPYFLWNNFISYLDSSGCPFHLTIALQICREKNFYIFVFACVGNNKKKIVKWIRLLFWTRKCSNHFAWNAEEKRRELVNFSLACWPLFFVHFFVLFSAFQADHRRQLRLRPFWIQTNGLPETEQRWSDWKWYRRLGSGNKTVEHTNIIAELRLKIFIYHLWPTERLVTDIHAASGEPTTKQKLWKFIGKKWNVCGECV